MIVALYGLPGLSFAEVTYSLTELGIGFLAVNGNLPKKMGEPDRKRAVPVVFSSAKSLIDNQGRIQFRSLAFVIDTYQRLRLELGWPCAGIEEKRSGAHTYTAFGAKDLGLLIQQADTFTEATAVNTHFRAYDPSANLIESFGETALSSSLTLMHKIKDQDMRARTFAHVREWFVGDIKTVDKLYTKIAAIHKNAKYRDALMQVLTSTDGVTLRKVSVAAKAKPTDLESLAKKNHIDASDIRYLLKGKTK